MSEELENKEEQVEEQEVKKEETPAEKTPDRYEELSGQIATLANSFKTFQESLQQKPEAKEEPATDDQFWSDPLTHINKTFDSKLNSVLNPITDMIFQGQKDSLRGRYKDFERYESEIDQLIKNFPQVKNQTGVAEKLYKMVKGLHIDDIETELRNKIQQEHEEKSGAFLEGGSASASKPATKTKLNSDEKEIAHKMMPHLTKEKAEEEYAKWKA